MDVPTSKCQSPVSEALSRLSRAEGRADSALHDLESRLESILAPDVKNIAGSKPDCGSPSASELHGRLLGDSEAVNSFAERIEGLMSRLTL